MTHNTTFLTPDTFLMFLMFLMCRFHVGDNLSLASSRQYGSYRDIPGGDIKVPGGLTSLVDILDQSFVRDVGPS